MQGRKKKVLIVLGVGSVILVWRAYALITANLPATVAASPAVEEMVLTPPEATESAENDPSLKPIWDAQKAISKSDWGRDPFKDIRRGVPANSQSATPVSVTPPTQPSIKFTGVSKSRNQWLAATKGTIVRVGDKIQEKYKIIDITQDSIVLESEGWIFTFAVGASEASVRPSGESP